MELVKLPIYKGHYFSKSTESEKQITLLLIQDKLFLVELDPVTFELWFKTSF
jgi:hypothetical protein